MDEACSICGDNLKLHYSHKLECDHIFHYECLLKSFKGAKNNVLSNTLKRICRL